MLSQIESIWSDYTEIVCIISVNSDWAVQKKKTTSKLSAPSLLEKKKREKWNHWKKNTAFLKTNSDFQLIEDVTYDLANKYKNKIKCK